MNAILVSLILTAPPDWNMAVAPCPPHEFVMCDTVPPPELVMVAPPLSVFAPKPVAAHAGYPVRGNWWTHPGATNRVELIEHLMQGVHRGKFSREWLNTLTMPQLESLHSDDHEGKVRYAQPVLRPASKSPS